MDFLILIFSEKFCEGRPLSSVVDTNVYVVREMIEQYRHETEREIQTTSVISI